MAKIGDNEHKLGLSVAIIARNEADVIAQSIQSVQAIADEVVVLDTGSNDHTVKIAEQLGARVVPFKWCDDFSAARNRLMSECRGRWVLWLDAGETLLSESAPLLRVYVDRNAEPDKAYLTLIDVPAVVEGASSEQIAQPRLLPNRADLRFAGRVRESVLPAIESAGLELSTAPAMIHRHARQHNASQKVRNAQRDLRLIELESQADESARLLIAKGEALSNLDRQKEAAAVFRRAVEVAEHESADMLAAFYGLLTAHESDSLKKQMDVCMEALGVFPLDAQLLCALGNYLQAQGQIDLAARSFSAAVEHGQINIQVWHLAEIVEIATACWAITLQLQDNHDRAISVLQDGIARHVGSQRLRRRLIGLYVKNGNAEQALPLVDDLVVEDDAKTAFASAVRGAAHAALGQWLEALGHLQSAHVAGCQEPLCLRWLAVTLLSNGQGDKAEAILRQWQAIEPDNPEPLEYLDAIKRQTSTRICMGSLPGQFGQPNVYESDGHAGLRRHRIDPAASVFHTGCAPMPIIAQTSTVDEAAR